MNAPKCQPEDDINFLVASPRAVRGTEAARVQPTRPDLPAHDAFTRLVHRLEPDPETLWAEAAPQVGRAKGVLVLDDSTLDKPYARAIGLLTRHWSGKHRRVAVLWAEIRARGFPGTAPGPACRETVRPTAGRRLAVPRAGRAAPGATRVSATSAIRGGGQ